MTIRENDLPKIEQRHSIILFLIDLKKIKAEGIEITCVGQKNHSEKLASCSMKRPNLTVESTFSAIQTKY